MRITAKLPAFARLGLAIALVLVVFAGAGRPVPAAAGGIAPFDDRSNPVYLIQSYYNAIHFRDYARAYGYWNGSAPGGATLDQFAQGFANVEFVQALARLPIIEEGAAGTTHAEVPVVLLTSLLGGGFETYAGCFHVTRLNVGVGNPPVIDPNWRLEGAQLQRAASADFMQAVNACSFHTVESFPTASRGENRLSSPDLISSYYDAIAAGDYGRAYNYWSGGVPNQTLAQFAQGFAGTSNIGVVVALDFVTSSAAGSTYTSSPLLLTSTSNGVQQLYMGCVVTRISNVPVGNPSVLDPNWSINSASFTPIMSLADGLEQVWFVCRQ